MLQVLQVLSVDVLVLMPYDTINNQGKIKNIQFLNDSFKKLKEGNVHGIAIDVWWGIVERNPSQYNFEGYLQVFELAKSYNLKVRPILSFHKCTGNVSISIPQWALETAKRQSLLFQDQWGYQSDEYIAISADNQKVFPTGANQLYRTPLDIYSDFMTAFNDMAIDYLNDETILQIQIGLGPNGELRYPSHPSAKWKYPGIGAFQAFDPLMLKDFQSSANKSGFDYNFPPTDAGSYNSKPDQTTFFVSGYNRAVTILIFALITRIYVPFSVQF
ncbi:Beta-amylase [Hexamita inflata]|uniref:Beta-amylase n=1 Tax=Hexamita inflata TaxID=28002 RepID=A0AA86P338_9EUKA|nr:Beta-amylase [Hexamita inflata]